VFPDKDVKQQDRSGFCFYLLDYLASGMTHADILREFPYFTEQDIRACLAFAADRERKSEMLNA